MDREKAQEQMFTNLMAVEAFTSYTEKVLKLVDALKHARTEVYKLAMEHCPERAGEFDAIFSKGSPIGKTLERIENET